MAKEKSSMPATLFAFCVPVLFAVILVFPQSREVFLGLTKSQPYLMGFIKFALLATAGEVIASKIVSGCFKFSLGAPAKAAIWGLIGMMMVVLMPVYSGGTIAAQNAGVLFGKDNTIITAIFTSCFMNLTFGLAMMAFHRVTDTMIELKCRKQKANALTAVSQVNWSGFVGFVVFRTLPLFWIPAHSITFSLPSELRVFVSAFLSLALGVILALAKKRKTI